MTISIASRTDAGSDARLIVLNTVAGSIFVTLTIADSAEIAHMNNVKANSQNAKPGVITNGKANCDWHRE